MLAFRSLLAAGALAGVLLTVMLVAATGGRGLGEAHGQGQLEGAWTTTSAEREGRPADELRGHALTFARETFVIRGRDGTMLYRGTYTIDAAKKPARIDFRHTDGELKGQTWLGVYVLDGDTLKIADNAVDVRRPRPTSLTTGPNSGHVLLTFKRGASR